MFSCGEIDFALIILFHVQIQEPAKQVNYHKGISLSCKICWILLSQNIWNKSMTTQAFAWMNVAPVASL